MAKQAQAAASARRQKSGNDNKQAQQGQVASSQAGNQAANGAQQAGADAIELLKQDHREVEQLFTQFESTREARGKQEIVRKVCMSLAIHTLLEEEIFYEECRRHAVEHRLLDEAQVEHDGAKVLIADIEMHQPGEQYYDAKVKVLSEYIRHHVAEEEKGKDGIFSAARQAGLDLKALGQRIAARKKELTEQFANQGLQPLRLRSINVNSNEIQTEEQRMNRGNYDQDRDRDSRGRFTEGNQEGRNSRGGGGSWSGQGGWFGDSEGHARAAQQRWDRDR